MGYAGTGADPKLSTCVKTVPVTTVSQVFLQCLHLLCNTFDLVAIQLHHLADLTSPYTPILMPPSKLIHLHTNVKTTTMRTTQHE
jgi:hypothetical protein